MSGRRSENPTEKRPREHLAVEEVVAYVHGALSFDARSKVESHLADCAPCRREVVEVSGSIQKVGRSRHRWWASVATAAGLAGLVAMGLLTRGSWGGEEFLFRDGPSSLQQERIPQIEVVEPRDGTAVDRESPRFVWRALESGGSYRFTLTDGSGDVLWLRDTRDTVLLLGPEVPLRPGDEYFWYVDTLLETGVSATTSIVRFRVAKPDP